MTAKCTMGVPSISGLELVKAVTSCPPPTLLLCSGKLYRRQGGGSHHMDPTPGPRISSASPKAWLPGGGRRVRAHVRGAGGALRVHMMDPGA